MAGRSVAVVLVRLAQSSTTLVYQRRIMENVLGVLPVKPSPRSHIPLVNVLFVKLGGFEPISSSLV